ncbi:hypothetical protein BHM03_00039443 [Ensete ventricosum]|nr:hypothetical protein BHM03_00039443 [Ensete ventricosum]
MTDRSPHKEKPKSVKDLCSARLGEDGRDYHAIRVSNQLERAPNVPLKIDLTPLMHGMQIWLDGEASVRYAQGTHIPRLAIDLYSLSSKVLMNQAAKSMVLVSSISAHPFLSNTLTRPLPWQSQHCYMALLDQVHDAGRVITALDNKSDVLHKEVQRLKEGSDPDAVAVTNRRASKAQSLAENLQVELEEATQQRESLERELGETRNALSDSRNLPKFKSSLLICKQLAELTRAMDALRVDLPKQDIEDYKKSPGFEMGLVRMGWVSLEYGYQLALARLQAQHPGY